MNPHPHPKLSPLTVTRKNVVAASNTGAGGSTAYMTQEESRNALARRVYAAGDARIGGDGGGEYVTQKESQRVGTQANAKVYGCHDPETISVLEVQCGHGNFAELATLGELLHVVADEVLDVDMPSVCASAGEVQTNVFDAEGNNRPELQTGNHPEAEKVFAATGTDMRCTHRSSFEQTLDAMDGPVIVAMVGSRGFKTEKKAALTPKMNMGSPVNLKQRTSKVHPANS